MISEHIEHCVCEEHVEHERAGGVRGGRRAGRLRAAAGRPGRGAGRHAARVARRAAAGAGHGQRLAGPSLAPVPAFWRRRG